MTQVPHAITPAIEMLWRFGIVAAIALGAWLVLRCGRVMLGNAGFAAIAAAVTAALAAHGATAWLASAVGIAAAAAAGAIFGFAAARASATGFAVASLSLWAVELSVRAPSGESLHSNATPLWIVAAALVAAACAWRFALSRAGIASAAVAQDERAAEGVGIDPIRARILAVTAGALLAGVAGSFSVFYPAFDITAYRLHTDVAGLAAVVIGGVGSALGPLVGAALVAVAAVAPLTKAHAAAVNAVALLAATIVLPGGILSLFARSARR